MESIDFFTKLVNSLDCEVSEDDPVVRYKVGDERSAVGIDGMNLVMPYMSLLREGQFTNVVPFAPLSENIVRGQSPVIEKLRTMIVMKVTKSVLYLANSLITLAANVDMHERLTSKESKFLDVLKNCDGKTEKAMEKVTNRVDFIGENRVVRIYLNRGGSYKGVKYARVAVVDFPIMESEDEKDTKIFGVNMSKENKRQILGILEWILPGCSEVKDGPFTYGSKSKYAPYFDSLLGAYKLMADAINDKVKIMKKHIDVDAIAIDTSWAEYLPRLKELSLEIPALKGNEGTIGLDEAKGEKHASVAAGLSAKDPRATPRVSIGNVSSAISAPTVNKVEDEVKPTTITPKADTDVRPSATVAPSTTIRPSREPEPVRSNEIKPSTRNVAPAEKVEFVSARTLRREDRYEERRRDDRYDYRYNDSRYDNHGRNSYDNRNSYAGLSDDRRYGNSGRRASRGLHRASPNYD